MPTPREQLEALKRKLEGLAAQERVSLETIDALVLAIRPGEEDWNKDVEDQLKQVASELHTVLGKKAELEMQIGQAKAALPA